MAYKLPEFERRITHHKTGSETSSRGIERNRVEIHKNHWDFINRNIRGYYKLYGYERSAWDYWFKDSSEPTQNFERRMKTGIQKRNVKKTVTPEPVTPEPPKVVKPPVKVHPVLQVVKDNPEGSIVDWLTDLAVNVYRSSPEQAFVNIATELHELTNKYEKIQQKYQEDKGRDMEANAKKQEAQRRAEDLHNWYTAMKAKATAQREQETAKKTR